MSRYIKLADALRTLADSCYLDEIDENMQKLPSIDIVRCKECIYYHDDECNNGDFPLQGYGDVWISPTPDDFCSYGEREVE